MALENVIDNLREGYSQLEKGSLRQVDQLHTERQSNHALRNQFFYTADGNGYFLREDGGVDWAITAESENLVLRHIGDAVNSSYDQLISEGNFHPDNEEAEAARRAEATVVVDMSKLRLSGEDSQYRFLAIRTRDGFVKTEDEYQAPTEEEQKAMTRLGYTSKTLGMLNKGKIAETKIFVPNPEYVAQELGNSNSNSLWWASWLPNFSLNSDFNANDHNVNNHNALRGVRIIAEGDAQKNEIPQAPQEITPEICYKTLLADRGTAVATMNDETAAGLSAILTDYLATKAQ